jgi:H+/Cl- antiporter ClcA
MSLLGRIIVIIFAVMLASLAAGLMLAIGIIAPDWTTMDSDPVERVIFFVGAFFATSFVGAVALFPAVLLIALAEAMRIRSVLYYGVAGAVVGLASYFGSDISFRLENTTDVTPVGHVLQLAAAAGIVGGQVDLKIAGRKACAWRAS